MLDYLGDFPAPGKLAVVSIITEKIYREYEKYNIDRNDVEFITSVEYDKFGSLGSQAAWVHCTQKMLTNNVRNMVKEKLCVSTT